MGKPHAEDRGRQQRDSSHTGRGPWSSLAAPVILSVLVVIGAVVPTAPFVYSGERAPRDLVTLEHSLEYLLLAPVTRALDEMSLLTARQHVAVLVTALLVGIAWMLVRAARAPGTPALLRVARMARDLGLAGGVMVAVYVFGLLLPRPMVSLRASNPDDLLVDFHSHTDHSHDGRWRFDAESNRDWHAAAGFDAAYITDHQTMAAWQDLATQRALSRPPTTLREASLLGAGARPTPAVLLPGIETVVPGAHINLLGVSAVHQGWFSHRRNLDTVRFAAAVPAAPLPLALLTLPFDITRDPSRVPRLDAIEISNGAPRGMAFAREHRARILQLADSLGIPLVAASNNHGWGATAVAWTVVRVPGWRSMSPEALDAGIRTTLRTAPGHVSVVERAAVAEGAGTLALATTVPRLAAHVARVVQPLERVAFLAWIWLAWLVGVRRSRRRVARG